LTHQDVHYLHVSSILSWIMSCTTHHTCTCGVHQDVHYLHYVKLHDATRCNTLHDAATHCCNFAYVDVACPLIHATRTFLINTCHTHTRYTHMCAFDHQDAQICDIIHCNTLQHTATRCKIAVIECGVVDDARWCMCDAREVCRKMVHVARDMCHATHLSRNILRHTATHPDSTLEPLTTQTRGSVK